MDLTTLSPTSAPLPWHGQVWARLQQQLEVGNLPHALLLTGPVGIGKARLAEAMARLLLCHSPKAGHNCGECHACELSCSGGHGDWLWVQPEGTSKIVKVDQVRRIVDFGVKTASFGQRKVVVIAPADAMNISAANSLLKSLEEPTADTYLLLVCHRPHRLPATVRSRCQRIDCPVPTAAEAQRWLEQATGSSDPQLLALAEGAPLAAEAYFREGVAEQLATFRQALNDLNSGAGSIADGVKATGDIPLDIILGQFSMHISRQIKVSIIAANSAMTCRGAFGILDELNRAQRAVESGANPNRQLLLESLLVRYRQSSATGVLS